MDTPQGPLARVGRRADFDAGTYQVHNGFEIVDLAADEMDDWLHARYTEHLANQWLLADEETALIPVRNGILWDMPDTKHPVILGIIARQPQTMTLTREELDLWVQADGVTPLSALSDHPWPLVVRLVQSGAWNLRWDPDNPEVYAD